MGTPVYLKVGKSTSTANPKRKLVKITLASLLNNILNTENHDTYLAEAKCVGALLHAIKSLSSNRVAATLLFDGNISVRPSATSKWCDTRMRGPSTIFGVH